MIAPLRKSFIKLAGYPMVAKLKEMWHHYRYAEKIDYRDDASTHDDDVNV